MLDGPDTLERFASVSRETLDRLAAHVDLLRRWQSAKNLVGPATLADVWTRHVADCLQLTSLAPLSGTWVDMGSGAGFPGLVIAIAMTDPALAASGGRVHLIESNQRKAAFLREAARITGAPATVHAVRLEEALPRLETVDVITARALAPLSDLVRAAKPFVDKGAVALFPKGQDVESELTQATRFWTLDLDRLPSRTDPAATILRIRAIRPLDPARP